MDRITFLSFQYTDAAGTRHRRSLKLSNHPQLAAVLKEIARTDSEQIRHALSREFEDIAEIDECIGWLATSQEWIKLL